MLSLILADVQSCIVAEKLIPNPLSVNDNLQLNGMVYVMRANFATSRNGTEELHLSRDR